MIDAGVRQMHPAQVRCVQGAAQKTAGEGRVGLEGPGEACHLDLRQLRGLETLPLVGRQGQRSKIETVRVADGATALTEGGDEGVVGEQPRHTMRLILREAPFCCHYGRWAV